MQMRLVLFIFFIFNLSFAQVGIKTSSPTRKLHVAGAMRVRTTINKSEAGAYDRILVTDANGNIDYTTKTSLQPTPVTGTSNKESYSQIYNMTTENGDPTKTLKCGKFYFSFQTGNDSRINFRLAEQPAATVNIYMSMEQNWDGNGYQFYQGTTASGTGSDSLTPFTFTTSNWNVNQDFASSNVADFEQNIMHFQYPGDTDFYRLTIYRALQSTGSSSWDFAATCEKF